ncbi:UNVERIFIED_CONTAM: hypothetical protein GTU68_014536 [Idotea baltica]|nr:hypothetical protein [Idotea baltica]
MISFLAFGLFVTGCDQWVKLSASKVLYDDVKELPAHSVALVLGTSRYVVGGRTNLFFKYRMDAAARLYKNGKVKHLILSGDNRTVFYDEPSEMRKALLSRGIPSQAMTLDYAGFRTLDSIIRCKEVFGQNKFVIISQQFHNERAVFIAQAKGIRVVAFNAQSVSRRYAPKTYIREYFARVKAIMDVYILQKQPKFLGKKVHIAV